MRRTYLVINHTIVTCWVICVLMVLLVPGSALWAQISSKPFASVEQAVNAQRAGWAGDKSKLSAVFDQERRRLRDQFEPELLKWLGQDPERHYWISSFLKADSYLHGNKRLPQLSLLVMEQGLTLVRNKDVEEIQGYVVRFSILAATLSAELGFSSLAASHKSEGEALLKRNSDLSVFVPGMNEADRRLYESIRSTVVPPPTVIADPNSPPKAHLSGGVLNGRAVKLGKPKYPAEADKAGASGFVTVRIVFDETGKVIWARAISGHPLLRSASEDAAWQSTFPPTKLSGQPVKMMGVLVFNFVR